MSVLSGAIGQTPPRPALRFSIGPNLAGDTRTMSSAAYPGTNPSILNTSPSAPTGWPETFHGMNWFNASYADIDIPRGRYNNKPFLANLRAAGKKVSIEVAAGFYPEAFCSSTNRNNPARFYDAGFTLPRFADYGNMTEGFRLADTSPTHGAPVKGQLDYLILDDPFLRAYDRLDWFNTEQCASGLQPLPRWDFDFIKNEVVKYMQYMKARFPGVKFVLATSTAHWNYTTPTPIYYPSISGHGDGVTLPSGAYLNYKNVLDAFVPAAAAAGVPLDGLILDYPYNWVTETTTGTAPNLVPSGTLLSTSSPEYANRWGRASGLVADAHNRSLKAYLFVNSDRKPLTTSDEVAKSAAFRSGSVSYIADVTNKGIPFDMALVQSWYYDFQTGGPPTAPRAILNESDTNSFTNTARDVLNVISAYNEPVFGMTGYVDGIFGSNLLGWACAKYVAQSPTVHVYTGTASAPVNFYGVFVANQSSELGIASACQTSFTKYRFSIPITSAPSGSYLWVYGLSPIGGYSKLLTPQVVKP